MKNFLAVKVVKMIGFDKAVLEVGMICTSGLCLKDNVSYNKKLLHDQYSLNFYVIYMLTEQWVL